LGEISNHHYSIMVRYSSLKWWRVVGVALLGGLIFKEKLKVLKGGSWKVYRLKSKLLAEDIKEANHKSDSSVYI